MIASSWSVNPRKGAETFAWLDRHLDRDRYELTYLGQPPAPFEWIRRSARSARRGRRRALRGSDVYVAASRDDPCSNALLRRSRAASRPRTWRAAATPSLVGSGGLRSARTRSSRGARPARRGPTASAGDRGPSPSVADRYLEVLGLATSAAPRIAALVENYLRRCDCRAYRLGAAPRPRRSRAHDVFYLSAAWTKARWLGAQALKNPLDLWIYQEIIFRRAPSSWSRPGTYRGGSALPRIDVRPSRGG